ncbi:PssD/Cps14F family polysaccharide biosynthesis glycosyltransferase [Sinosporangium siamense]|uniref:UDP-N-acetylglucosamine--LPS N-acetylglucosamine transferase n=1 Tax=Sinosporangium siamense TaxID=1367973 RepID=A0A919RGW4_9ACTN|nr:PssD/Cps14F family polysaccharide biosynthesis glycosyltransferase [Sinosporangium siamense]GII93517.1 UDP-N-acetylglucosamine--LPS N-acetylglucosamine transferase [Sinosporangium siamense]
MKVLFVCSGGGHLGQLYRLRSWWQGEDRHWVTFKQTDALSLLAEEKVTWAYHPTTRNIPNLLRNLFLAVRLLPTYRPDVIVSTGAGVAYPFFLLAKLFGSRTVYLEVYDRIDTQTLTGKLCYPLSDLFLLQWPEQREIYPKGVVVGQVM